MRNFFNFVFEIAKIIIIALLIVIPVRYFLFQPFIVRGQSMEPNFHDGDYLIIDELSYDLRNPQRGEVIVFKSPTDLSSRYIKRIIGLPGETIEVQDGEIIIYNISGKELKLEEDYLPENLDTTGNMTVRLRNDEYFVLGDNRSRSLDSRRFGSLPEKNIIGKVFLRAWPITSLEKVGTPAY